MIWLLFEMILIVLRTRIDKTAVTYIEFALYKLPLQISIYLSFFLYKQACRSLSHPAAFLPALVFLLTTISLSGLFENGFTVLDIKSLMIAANFTLGEVIWLFFELVLIVLRYGIDKTAVTYIEVGYKNHHFKCLFIYDFFLYKEACRFPSHPAACLPAVGISQQRVSYRVFFEHGFSMLDIKPLMIAANLTLGQVIWLLFDLVLIVLWTGTDKTAVTYIEVELYKPPF